MTVPINGALRVRGVALVVRNPRGEILLVEEGETKPEFGKYAGMFSPPMETLLYRKEPLLTAVGRLIAEEIPGFSGHITVEEKWRGVYCLDAGDRKSTRLNSSHSQISYAVFCFNKNKK